MVHDLCNYVMYGNASADAYEFSGFDTFITTNRINKAVGGAAFSSLSTLDDLIDRNIELQGMDHKKAFIMSPRMLSRASQLLTNVRLNQVLPVIFHRSTSPVGGGSTPTAMFRLLCLRHVGPVLLSRLMLSDR
jgi:hypothetical protein